MPHTINLVSQFEDIIRRGGNGSDGNISNVFRAGWGRHSAPRQAGWREKRVHSKSDESPPALPKRAPISQYNTHHNYASRNVSQSNDYPPYRGYNEKPNLSNDESQISTISKDIGV